MAEENPIKNFLRQYSLAIAEGMDINLTKKSLEKAVEGLESDEELFEFIDSKVMEYVVDERRKELEKLIKCEREKQSVCATSKQDLMYLDSLEEELENLDC